MENYSLTQLSEVLQLPRTSTYRYVVRHKNFLNISKRGRRLFIPVDAVPILKEIRRLYDQGHDGDQINTVLSENMALPMTIDVVAENEDEPQAMAPAKALGMIVRTMQEFSEESKAMQEKVERLTKGNQRLEERLIRMEKNLEKIAKGKSGIINKILDTL